jgi:hypothetical protein
MPEGWNAWLFLPASREARGISSGEAGCAARSFRDQRWIGLLAGQEEGIGRPLVRETRHLTAFVDVHLVGFEGELFTILALATLVDDPLAGHQVEAVVGDCDPLEVALHDGVAEHERLAQLALAADLVDHRPLVVVAEETTVAREGQAR